MSVGKTQGKGGVFTQPESSGPAEARQTRPDGQMGFRGDMGGQETAEMGRKGQQADYLIGPVHIPDADRVCPPPLLVQ